MTSVRVVSISPAEGRHGHTHRLWLDNFFKDLKPEELKELKRQIDNAITKGKTK